MKKHFSRKNNKTSEERRAKKDRRVGMYEQIFKRLIKKGITEERRKKSRRKGDVLQTSEEN